MERGKSGNQSEKEAEFPKSDAQCKVLSSAAGMPVLHLTLSMIQQQGPSFSIEGADGNV